MPVIAVDGPAASGKGTIARALAGHFGLPHLDTGALYRAVALAGLRAGYDLDDAPGIASLVPGIGVADLADPAIREASTAEAASRVSLHPAVRAALLQLQRDFAARPGGAVLDGRDIGTVIAPAADAKLFVTASPDVRARRRWRELGGTDARLAQAQVLADILARDTRDSARAEAPLRQATDADLLDTSDFDIDAAVRRAIDMVSARLGRTS